MSDSRTAETLFRPGQNCVAGAHAGRFASIIDGAAYFDAFMRAARRAERSIVILAWDFDSRAHLCFDDDGKPRTTLGEFLNSLAHRRRRLHIRVLDWDYPMVFGTDREFPPIYGLGWRPHRRVHLRYDDTHPLAGSHHQKIAVIDDKVAFVGGLDFTCRRWDTPEHRPDDTRRLANGKPYPPFHDVMALVDGDAARVLSDVARERWRLATGEDLDRVVTRGDPWPEGIEPEITDVEVGVARTVPATNGGKGVREVEQLYLDMIARAKRHIYIENQYFTSQRIGAALAARLKEADAPEIVVVSRLLSHGWLEEATMHVLRTRLVTELRAADRHQRFHIYCPHIEGLTEGTCVDLHSKVMAVDDEWLRIGSANLSNRSMGVDTECDVVLEARGEPRVAAVVRGVRDRLIAEHLGVETDTFARTLEQSGSMSSAITRLTRDGRTLKPLHDLREWPDVVVDTISITDPEQPVSLDRIMTEFASDTEVHRGMPMWLRVVIVALVVAGLTATWRYTPLAEVVTAENITDWARTFAGYWWAPFVILFAYTPACIVMFPRPLITLAAVVAFGPWLGFTYSMSGILIAAMVTYYAGRLFHRDTIRRIAGDRLNRLSDALRRRGLLAMVALRLVPLAPFSVESMVAGAIRIKVSDMLIGTFLGMLPGVLTATVFGDQLETALRDPSQINWWLVGGVALVFLIGTLWVRKWFARMEAAEHAHESGHAGDAKEREPGGLSRVSSY